MEDESTQISALMMRWCWCGAYILRKVLKVLHKLGHRIGRGRILQGAPFAIGRRGRRVGRMGALLCQPVGGLRTSPDLSDPHMESTMQAKGDVADCIMNAC